MLDASETLEQFRDTLLTAYPEIDRAGMVAAMAEAFTAAHLWGMAEP
jgi:phage gp29-like protein